MRYKLSIVILLFLVSVCWSGLPVYYTQVSASDVSSTVTISLATTSNQAYTLTVANDGANEIFVNTNGAPATSSNQKLLAGEIMVYHTDGGYAITVLSIICSAGETSTVRVFGFPTK